MGNQSQPIFRLVEIGKDNIGKSKIGNKFEDFYISSLCKKLQVSFCYRSLGWSDPVRNYCELLCMQSSLRSKTMRLYVASG